MANNLKIPEELFITFQNRNKEDYKLGFMSPHGTDAAAAKRRHTQLSWAYGYTNARNFNLETLDFNGKHEDLYNQKLTSDLFPKILKNEALSGYTFARAVKRYGWNGGNVVWRIDDPRGFQLEISSANLGKIMQYADILQGSIAGKCIWGRMGSDNILIPEGSDLYEEAVKSTERLNTKVSLRDVKVGDLVELQNGKIGYYYGKFWLVNFDYNKIGKVESCVERRFFKHKDSDSYFSIANPKISSVLETTEIDNPLEQIMNYLELGGILAKEWGKYRINDKKVTSVKEYFIKEYSLQELEEKEIINLNSNYYKPFQITSDIVLLAYFENKWHIFSNCRNSYNSSSADFYKLNSFNLTFDNQLERQIDLLDYRYGYDSYNQTETFNLADVEKWGVLRYRF